MLNDLNFFRTFEYLILEHSNQLKLDFKWFGLLLRFRLELI